MYGRVCLQKHVSYSASYRRYVFIGQFPGYILSLVLDQKNYVQWRIHIENTVGFSPGLRLICVLESCPFCLVR